MTLQEGFGLDDSNVCTESATVLHGVPVFVVFRAPGERGLALLVGGVEEWEGINHLMRWGIELGKASRVAIE